MSTAVYQLMDTDSASLLGSYDSELEALHAVAVAAAKYGRDSEAVLNLVLFREDGPEDEAHIAEGEALIERALLEYERERITNGAKPLLTNGVLNQHASSQ